MKLNQILNNNEFIILFKNNFAEEDKPFIGAIATQFYLRNINREVRAAFNDINNFRELINSFCILNKQRLKYIIETATSEFLSTESMSSEQATGTTTGEDLDYNTDYYGGEGTTGKASGNSSSTSNATATDKVIDNTRKLSNFYLAENNSLFKQLENRLFETFEIDEELVW